MMKFVKRMEWIAATALLGAAPFVFAQGLTNPLSTTCSGTSSCFTTVLNNVLGFLFNDIAVPLATIMVLVGAFQMMTAAGDPEKFSKGRKTLLYAAVGFAVALIAGGVTSLLKSILNGQ